jgi:Cu/Ag efflux pump CusA
MFFAKGVRETKEPFVQHWLKRAYGGIIKLFAGWPRVVICGVLVVCVGTLFLLPHFGSEFLPEFREGHFVLGVQMTPGTSLSEMLRMGDVVSHELLKNPNIATVEQQAGRAEQGEDTWGPHHCEFHVELQPNLSGETMEKTADAIRDILAHYPGLQYEVLTFLGDRIGETISGETAPVVLNVYGDDLDLIDAKAKEVAGVLSTVRGAADVQLKSPPGAPRMNIRLRTDRLTQFGFRPVEVLEAIQTAYQGAIVAQVHEGSKVSDVAVILADESRREPEQVGELLLKNSGGLRMPLNQLADVYLDTARYSIMHDGARRRQVVTCTPKGRDVTSFVAEAQKTIAAKVQLPKGVYVIFTGAAEATAKAQRQLFLNSAIAGVGILLLLGVVTGNWRNLLLILANVPFALVGGILAVAATSYFGDPGEGGLNIGSLVGFVTLFGITTRNSIMMISHFEHLVREEGMTWGLETALRGASERLIPILMTALVTALGLLPLAIGTGDAGREIEGPMAIVILGGLITSTILNLLVLPTLALRFGRFAKIVAKEE